MWRLLLIVGELLLFLLIAGAPAAWAQSLVPATIPADDGELYR
jgi:hypothetical protein